MIEKEGVVLGPFAQRDLGTPAKTHPRASCAPMRAHALMRSYAHAHTCPPAARAPQRLSRPPALPKEVATDPA